MAGELPVWFNLESVRVYKEQGGTIYELDVPNVNPTVGIESPPIIGSMQSVTNIPKVVFTTPSSVPEDVQNVIDKSAQSVSTASFSFGGIGWEVGLALAGLAWLLFKRK